jgi:alpha-amylase
VGECWDGTNTIRSWIDATSKTSAAFDFQFRYVVRNAANGQNWNLLDQQNDNNWPLVSDKYRSGSYRRYAVTFVENHDTEYRSASAPQDPLKKDTLAANAYMLAMPGTPCVFQKHWLAYKQEIANMVAVRKAVGIHSMSVPTKKAANQNYYAVEVEGSDGKKLLCVVGKNAATYTPEGDWKKAISGYHYAYYVKGIEPSAIVLPQLKADEQQPDGKYSGVPSFCTVGEGEICAFFEAPATWGSQIFTWAWMTGKDGKDYLGTSWPGVAANYLGTAPNGNKVFKWTSGKTTAPDNIIFSGGGQQTADMPFANGGYYTKDGRQTVVTTGISRLAAGRPAAGTLRVATTDGRLLRQLLAGTTVEAALSGLPHGIYLVDGRKIVQ